MPPSPTIVSPQRLVESAIPMTARDGVVLRSVIHRMVDRDTQPIALVRNPYGEPLTRNLPIAALLAAGFAVIIQDCRGTGDSDGEFVPFENEGRDTEDAIRWSAQLPFSTGRVVMYGQSYSGMVQFAGAVTNPEGLAGIIPVFTPHDYHTGLAYRGGAAQLGQLTGWYTMKTMQSLIYRAQRGDDVRELIGRFGRHATDMWGSIGSGPLAEAPVISEVFPTWRRWLTEEITGSYWPTVSYRERRSEIATPALHIGGWFDLFLGGTIDNFTTLRNQASNPRAREGQRLIIGPWQHIDQSGTVGDLSFGVPASAAGVGLEAMIAAFAAAAAAGGDIPGAPVKLYVMGAGRWRDEQEWPLARTEWTPWYLQPGGALSPIAPSVDSDPSTFVHDPDHPVPMRGGQSGIFAGGLDGGSEWTPGPRDQRPLDDRGDILHFIGAPLDTDIEVTGPVAVTLFAATSADDTDFVARLIDVYPDGRAIGVVDGIVRAKFRNGQDAALPIVPDEVVEYQIDLWATSWLFRAGHRIRLDVASSSYPNWEPHNGSSAINASVAPADRRTATQRVHHDAEHPSHVLLPIIPPDTP
jgi:putative CocE/NonD family hydrolase